MLHQLQVQEYTEQPVGMALYEMKNGQISNICIQGGEPCTAVSIEHCFTTSWRTKALETDTSDLALQLDRTSVTLHHN